MQQGGEIMRKLKRLVNLLFLLTAVLIATLFILTFRQHRQERQKAALPGFTVFCEGEEISALYAARDCLWVGGRDGVKRLNAETGQVIDYVAEDLELIYAAEIVSSADGTVWIGHNEGVSLLKPSGERTDYGKGMLTGGRVNTILTEGGQTIVGTMEGANVFSLEEGEWRLIRQYTKEEGLLSDAVNVLAQTEGTIWFGSYLDNRPGGVSILSEKGWQYLTIEEGLSHPYINSILPLANQVLIATGQLSEGGLDIAEKTDSGYRITDSFSMADGIPGEKVRWLYRDSLGHLWITTESDGLLLCGDDVLTHPIDGILLQQEQGLSDNEVKKIVETEKYYFLAGRYGLTRIEKDAAEALLEGEG